MSTVADRVRGRVDLSVSTAGLLLGDLVAIASFVIIGEINHGIDPLANPGIVVDTYVPFLVGWLLAAGLAGVYARGLHESPRWMAVTVLGAWLVADAVGQLLRSTAYFHGDAALTFALVAAAVGSLFLVGWRLALVAVMPRLRSTGRV